MLSIHKEVLKTKFKTSKFGDLIDSLNDSPMKQCLVEQAESYSRGLYQMESFYRKVGGVRKLLAKGKEGLILDRTSFFCCHWGKKGMARVLLSRWPLFL